MVLGYDGSIRSRVNWVLECPMAEFMRSAAILFMGFTVIGAGMVVVFYG